VTDPTYYRRPSAWAGWIILAAVLMCLSGAFNIVTGLIAIFTDDVYVNTPSSSVVLDVTAYGWVHVVWGLVIIATGLSLVRGHAWGRIVAVLVVGFNTITQLGELPSYPFYSLLIIVVDLLVLWAVIVHGEEMRES
jgi:hypothetical protein